MMFKTDSIAILLATYNGGFFLKAQLDSLLSQTYSDFAIYISDDLSSDSTRLIIQKYVEKYPDKIIDIRNETHFGNARDNFFNLLLQVDAPFYMFCDQDDVWLNTKIEKTVSEYKTNGNYKEPVLIHSDLQVVNTNLEIISPTFREFSKTRKLMNWKQYLVENNNVVGCTMGINKALADLYKEKYKILDTKKIFMHDSYFAHLASLTGKILYIDEPLIKYRQHGNNSIGVVKKSFNLNLITKKIQTIAEGRKLQIKREENTGEIIKCCPRLDKNDYLISKAFSELHYKPKIKRIAFLLKNKIYRNSFIETLYMFMII